MQLRLCFVYIVCAIVVFGRIIEPDWPYRDDRPQPFVYVRGLNASLLKKGGNEYVFRTILYYCLGKEPSVQPMYILYRGYFETIDKDDFGGGSILYIHVFDDKTYDAIQRMQAPNANLSDCIKNNYQYAFVT